MAKKRIAILYVGQNHIGATHLCCPGQPQYKFDGQYSLIPWIPKRNGIPANPMHLASSLITILGAPSGKMRRAFDIFRQFSKANEEIVMAVGNYLSAFIPIPTQIDVYICVYHISLQFSVRQKGKMLLNQLNNFENCLCY